MRANEAIVQTPGSIGQRVPQRRHIASSGKGTPNGSAAASAGGTGLNP
jgi:hypothetical protein